MVGSLTSQSQGQSKRSGPSWPSRAIGYVNALCRNTRHPLQKIVACFLQKKKNDTLLREKNIDNLSLLEKTSLQKQNLKKKLPYKKKKKLKNFFTKNARTRAKLFFKDTTYNTKEVSMPHSDRDLGWQSKPLKMPLSIVRPSRQAHF